MSNLAKQFCQKHKDKTIQIFCLDKNCLEDAKCCIVCLQQNHITCKDDFLLGVDELQQLVQEQQQSKTKTNKLIQEVTKFLEEKIYQINMVLEETQKNFLMSQITKQYTNILYKSEILSYIKKYNFINYNTQTNQLEIQSKYNVNPDQLQDCLNLFEKAVEKKFDILIKDFEKLSLTLNNSLLVDDFSHHPSINIKDLSNSIVFERKTNDSAFNYYCCLYKNPLVNLSTFKINVIQVYENDRYIDIGLVNKNKFNQIQQKYINSFNSGGISFCGYSCSGGLTGVYSTKNSGDAKGLKPGYEYYMQYQPGDYLKFYDSSCQLDLKKDMKSNTEEMYLFCTVYHPQTKFSIQKIE